MINKTLKLIVINLIILVLALIGLDYLQYKQIVSEHKKTAPEVLIKMYPPPSYGKCFNRNHSTNAIQSFTDYYVNGDWGYLRKTHMQDSKKPSIILFGGSFTYGSFLDEEETFSYKLAQATGRSIYNRGVEAGGLAQMLYFLRDNNFYSQIKQPPEYIIYTYISNHQVRLNTNMHPYPLWLSGYNLQYKLKDNELVLKQNLPAIIYKPFIIKQIYSLFDKLNNKNTKETLYKRFALSNEIFLESKKLIEQHYPNAKFVILNYNFDYELEKEQNDIPFLFDVLKSEGFIILNTKDLVGYEFSLKHTAKDNFHPSAEVWDILVPKLVEKLNL